MKKKQIWIWNHYATNTFFDRGGRHYNFAKYLIKAGYSVRIFCASTVHNSNLEIRIPNGLYKEMVVDSVQYTFIDTPKYQNNGKKRALNMMCFFEKLFKVTNEYKKQGEIPDLILASSVHPLTLVAGIKVAKKIRIPCICEIRDLWPESLVAYGVISENGFINKAMKIGKKWTYKKADALIFTMPDGKECITDNGWGNEIDLNKVYYINNGVDLEEFRYNKSHWVLKDSDLQSNKFKIIYTGSIRKANSVSMILKAAKYLQRDSQYIFLIYGEGDELKTLLKEKEKNNLTNIVFKGKVDKKYIPYIINQGDLNIITGEGGEKLTRYGLSLNKLFDYVAGEKPILSNLEEGKTKIIENEDRPIGISHSFKNAEEFAEEIRRVFSDKQKYEMLCNNAKVVAKEYDFAELTNKLIAIINKFGI